MKIPPKNFSEIYYNSEYLYDYLALLIKIACVTYNKKWTIIWNPIEGHFFWDD